MLHRRHGDEMGPMPWVTEPLELHSYREEPPCELTPDQCAFKSRYWVYWYEADYRFALPTIALILSCIMLFSLSHYLSALSPNGWTKSPAWRRFASASRWASYRRWRLGGWSTQSLGAYILGAVFFIFFAAMTLGPMPYYWPNTEEVNYGSSPPIATRAGWMSLACLPFIIILSTKANPIATLLGTSHENLIVWHNWLAWASFVLALIHTFPFVVYSMDMGTIEMDWSMGGLWKNGVIALVAQAWLTFFSIRWLRERYYEFFKATHFFFALLFFVFFFMHCDHILSSWDYFIAAGVLYALSWLYSQVRIYFEHGLRHKAHLYRETGDMLRITINTRANWTPGQHIYLRFPSLGIHSITSHPFTICSLPNRNGQNQMVFYVRTRGGLTRRLAHLAKNQPGTSISVLLDGPYGGVKDRWFEGFDHYVVIGGGAGAGFTLGLAEWFVERSRQSNFKSRMTLVVSSRDPDLKQWYLEKLSEVDGIEDDTVSETIAAEPALSVSIHFTGISDSYSGSNEAEEGGEKDVSPPNQSQLPRHFRNISAQATSGRADLFTLGREAVAVEGNAVGFVVCGPGSMVHDVGQIAANAQTNILKGGAGASEVWFHKESFSA